MGYDQGSVVLLGLGHTHTHTLSGIHSVLGAESVYVCYSGVAVTR